MTTETVATELNLVLDVNGVQVNLSPLQGL
jgi:hypothetical protein